VEALNNLLVLDKKYQSKNRWSQDPVKMILPLHLVCTNEFSGGPQTVGWLGEKGTIHKTKIETDPKKTAG